MANPRKFSEKIALQKQKQAEGTAEFEKIMKEVYATKMDETQANQKILECCLVSPDSNNRSNAVSARNNGGGCGSAGSNGGGGASPDGTAGNVSIVSGGGSAGGSPTTYRESRNRSVGVGPMRRLSERKDPSPYGSSNVNVSVSSGNAILGGNAGPNIAYLSPPMDTSWRRSNSDSALHQSLNMAVAAENSFCPVGLPGVLLPGDINSLHANYQFQNQRSQSPNVGRSLSPQAPKRKNNMTQNQQNHSQQQNHIHMQQMQQQHQQNQMQQQYQQSQQHLTQQQQQQHQHLLSKFRDCNLPPNSLFKSLQEQAITFANTGSLPDLTSVHYSTNSPQHLLHQQQQQQQQQQQHNISSTLSAQNAREVEKSTSPFSPAGVGTQLQYHQPHSATSTVNVPTTAQTSPHLSFTNLAMQPSNASPNPAQTNTFTNLPTLGPANSTGNLTDYRQPLNPPSPGSSPGLLTSTAGSEPHTSAPASPIRNPQVNLQHTNMQTFDRYSPNQMGIGNLDSNFSSLNPSFHNHFEQFTLGDSNSSPEQHMQQHFQQNNFTSIEFEDFITSSNNQQSFSQNKLIEFVDLSSLPNRTTTAASNSNTNSDNTTTITTTCSNNNMLHHQSGQHISDYQQQLINNNRCSTNSNNGSNSNCGNNSSANNNTHLSQLNDENSSVRHDVLSSPIPSPLSGVLPSPSSPLPIPIPSQSPHHHQNQQLSLSLHSVQHSPSSMQSPHRASPISVSSPGVSAMCSASSTTSKSHSVPVAANSCTGTVSSSAQNPNQENQSVTPTTATNIPSIIFSDYSSNSDFPREMFDTLDLDLGQMDVAGLQMLSDQNTIMISDPSIEEGFRRDLN